MSIKRITDEEIKDAQIQGNLPNRPTQKSLYPDNTMTTEEVKKRFDKLPKLIITRYNELVSALNSILNRVLFNLPDFTEEDNGKIMGIESGEAKWIKFEKASGSTVIVGAVLEPIEVEDSPLIFFTIDGRTYPAGKRMSWGEWVMSSYNTGGLYINGTAVYTANGNFLGVYNTDLIVESRNYTTFGS